MGRVGRTSWHPFHIAERYALFTIIVLGESLLAASRGVKIALDTRSTFGELGYVVSGGLLIVFSMRWVYFDMPAGRIVDQAREAFAERLTGAFAWGDGHYLVFASAATGAGNRGTAGECRVASQSAARPSASTAASSRTTSVAARFSSRWASDEVPGMSKTVGA